MVRRVLSLLMAVAVLTAAIFPAVVIARPPYHETVAASASSSTAVAWNYHCDWVSIIPASADVTATFNPPGADTDGVLVEVGGFTFDGVGAYSVTIAQTTATVVEVYAW